MRIESDQAQTADIHRHWPWTAIARNKAHVPPLRERGNHPLLQSNRVEAERSFVGPVVIARYENSSRAGRNRLDLCLESAASIGPLRGAFGGNAPGINVVAEENNDGALGRHSGLCSQRVERRANLARVRLSSITDEEERGLDVRGRQFLERHTMAAASGGDD